MVFYVVVVTFLTAPLINNLTIIVSPTYLWFIHMPIIETKFGIHCIQDTHASKYCHGIWMENHLVSDMSCNINNLLQEMKNIGKFMCSVNDTTHAVDNYTKYDI